MQEAKSKKIIATWLYIGVAMIIIQVLLGGVTRLTGSGLSITEWKPILGALPPLNLKEWNNAFDQYKQIPQFKYLNADFTLSDFKFIYFWEWLHRLWARVIGLVFFLPFIYFIAKKMIAVEWIRKFMIIFFVGALQGLVGWLMVASGLNNDMLFVNYFKLATHFMTALVALVFVYWYALEFSIKSTQVALIANKKIKISTWLILILLCIQLSYGAFMAGLKAGTFASTWPSINGDFFPNDLLKHSFFSNPINLHFVHRNLAYLISILIIINTYSIFKKSNHSNYTKTIFAPICFVIIQILLGISTVLHADKPLRNAMGIFEWSAQLHQLVALFLLLGIIRSLFFMYHKPIAQDTFL